MGLPRMLVLIGSGETAPQMTRVQRMVVERLAAGADGGRAAVRAAVIDTPYRFQENAAAISNELLGYFGRRLGMDAGIAAYGRADDDVVSREGALDRVREAAFVFSGPGSPSYALRHWTGSGLAQILERKLADGGALVFASAAALTMGRLTVPVYEVYKAGADPFWLTGLDVLGSVGISAAIVPHWDNAEGSGHDTRFCFLGQRRLEVLEDQLPEGAVILGIDEHTALVFDLDEERVSVLGRGRMTIRERGRETVHRTGADLPLAELRRSASVRSSTAPRSSADVQQSHLAHRLLEFERALASERARSRLVEPMLATMLDLRSAARAAGDYAAADAIRDALSALGVELIDAGDGSTRYRLPG